MKLNKKQKRTATIASMAALLAVVLGMGGQTFAKYITTHDTVTNTAVVAKWGYVIQTSLDTPATAVNMFNTNYEDGDVKAISTDNLVAPGVGGSMTVTVSGQAEVKAAVLFDFTTATEVYLSTGTPGNGTAETYYPIKWTVQATDNSTDTPSTTTPVENEQLSDVVTYFEGVNVSKTYDAAAKVNMTYTISWNWAFENTTSGITGVTANEADTMIANYKTDSAKFPLPTNYTASTSVEFALDISVTQVGD